MNETIDEFFKKAEKESQDRAQTVERLLATADASKVFSQPVTSGDYTVITAAEVSGGGGFGSGMGFGPSRTRGKAGQEEQDVSQAGSPGEPVPEGLGGGGGGGGGSGARPVAAIVIGPEGVEVRPILDIRRLALTGLVGLALVGHFGLKLSRRG